MKCNVGKTDKIVRLVVGAAIVITGVVFKSWWGLVGLIPITTALVSWCPLYVPFGIGTCQKD
jgi:hypothetical protein